MLYWVPAGPSLTLSPRRKPRRVINVLAASSTDGGGPSSWLDSPAEAEAGERGKECELQHNSSLVYALVTFSWNYSTHSEPAAVWPEPRPRQTRRSTCAPNESQPKPPYLRVPVAQRCALHTHSSAAARSGRSVSSRKLTKLPGSFQSVYKRSAMTSELSTAPSSSTLQLVVT